MTQLECALDELDVARTEVAALTAKLAHALGQNQALRERVAEYEVRGRKDLADLKRAVEDGFVAVSRRLAQQAAGRAA